MIFIELSDEELYEVIRVGIECLYWDTSDINIERVELLKQADEISARAHIRKRDVDT